MYTHCASVCIPTNILPFFKLIRWIIRIILFFIKILNYLSFAFGLLYGHLLFYIDRFFLWLNYRLWARFRVSFDALIRVDQSKWIHAVRRKISIIQTHSVNIPERVSRNESSQCGREHPEARIVEPRLSVQIIPGKSGLSARLRESGRAR